MIIREALLEEIPTIAIAVHSGMKDMGIIRNDNIPHTRELVKRCHRDGTLLLATTDDDVYIGSLGGWKMNNIYDPSIMEFFLAGVFVLPHRRGGTVFYRLIKEFHRYLDGIDVDRVVACHIPDHTGVNYERLGYQKAQTFYMMER